MLKMKKLLAVLLAIISVFALCATAMAKTDGEGPQISDVRVEKTVNSRDPQNVDVGVGETVKISAKVLDESGVDAAWITLTPVPANGSFQAYEYKDLEMTYNDDANRYELYFTITGTVCEGKYYISAVTAKDTIGNYTYFTQNQDVSDTFTVTNSLAYKPDSWKMTSFAQNKKDVAAGDTLAFEVKAVYSKSGFDWSKLTARYGKAELVFTGSNGKEISISCDYDTDNEDATTFEHYFAGSWTVPGNTKCQRYTLTKVCFHFQDAANYSYDFSGDEVKGYYFDVVSLYNDPDAPIVKSAVNNYAGKIVTMGDTVQAKIVAKDTGTGIDTVVVDLLQANGTLAKSQAAYYNKAKDAYIVNFTIDDEVRDGEYKLQYHVLDKAGNEAKKTFGKFWIYTTIVPTETVELSVPELSFILEAGDVPPFPEAYALSYTQTPVDLSVPGVTWSSSNEKVATVDDDGIITVVGLGECYITATSIDGFNVSDSCKVTVSQQGVESITIKDANKNVVKEMNLEITRTVTSGTVTLTAVVAPDNTYDNSVEWTSSDTDVATIVPRKNNDKKADLTWNGVAGQTVITCKAKDGSGVKASFVLTVSPKLATSIKLTKDKVLLVRTKEDPRPQYKMKAKALPTDAAERRLVWVSSNRKIAQVNQSGVITGLRKGVCVITVKVLNSKISTSFKVRVK